MRDKGEPDYIHFTRIKDISLTEAVWLLASFDLRAKNFADPNEYDKLLDEKKELARSVLNDAHHNGLLTYEYTGSFCRFDQDGDYYYNDNIKLNAVDFLSWAKGLNYDLPDILLKYINSTAIANDKSVQITDFTTSAEVVTTKVTAAKPKATKPKGYLAEAVERVFHRLPEFGKSDLSKPRYIREFIIFMKEMTTKGNRHADEEVMAKIKSIIVPPEGACSIKTEDNVVLRGQNETIIRGREYSNNDVAKILTRLRKNNC